jgi:hypothetical protein
MISVKSRISDDPNIDETDDVEIEIQSKRRFRLPFVFKILKLNSPEMIWIILGCLTSISFGAITPVSSSSIRNSFPYLSLRHFPYFFPIFLDYLLNEMFIKQISKHESMQ